MMTAMVETRTSSATKHNHDVLLRKETFFKKMKEVPQQLFT
jgi:hypothetical protein